MSVIIGRALPDVRDGLKPANRRVLYGMQEMGLQPGRPYRKCAKIVGEVMGNYHPHGDQAIYDTLVRMAQPFNMRGILVDGQGNFGSVDGDPPAAHALHRGAADPARRLDDGGHRARTPSTSSPTTTTASTEPSVLPDRLPEPARQRRRRHRGGHGHQHPAPQPGRGGGRAGLPPAEPGPHTRRAPRGGDREHPRPRLSRPRGFILGREGIRQAYRTGRGSVVMRARAEIEVRKNDRESIVITEIPYQVNKARLIEKIADLAARRTRRGDRRRPRRERPPGHAGRGRRQEGRAGAGHPQQPLQAHPAAGHLRHHPPGHRGPAPAGAEPPRRLRALPRLPPRVVVRRRTAYELRKAEARAHVLEGFVIALDHLDEVIALIRASKTPEEAKVGSGEPLRAQRDPGRRDPQAAAAAADRPRAPEDRGRAGRAEGAYRRPAGHPRLVQADRRDHHRRAHAAARDPRRSAAHRDRRRRQRDRGRGPHRRRGRGDLDHPHRLHQAHLASPATARSGAAVGARGDEAPGTRTSSATSSSPRPTPTS